MLPLVAAVDYNNNNNNNAQLGVSPFVSNTAQTNFRSNAANQYQEQNTPGFTRVSQQTTNFNTFPRNGLQSNTFSANNPGQVGQTHFRSSNQFINGQTRASGLGASNQLGLNGVRSQGFGTGQTFSNVRTGANQFNGNSHFGRSSTVRDPSMEILSHQSDNDGSGQYRFQ